MDEFGLELLLDHYKDPRNFGHLENPDVIREEGNPSCGDQIRIEIVLGDHDTIRDIRFSGKGCAISQAAASMLTEHIKGKSLEDVKRLGKREMLDLLGVEVNPMRLKCALLALKVVKGGLFEMSEWPNGDEDEGFE
jgi:nitrogen fixation NifU-like protein